MGRRPPEPTPGFIDITNGDAAPSATNIIGGVSLAPHQQFNSMLYDVFADRDLLVLPPPNGLPLLGTTPHTFHQPFDTKTRIAKLKDQGRDRHGRPTGAVQAKTLYSQASVVAADILSSVPARLRDLKPRRLPSSKEQQLLANFMSAGKSVYRPSDGSIDAHPSCLSSPTAPNGYLSPTPSNSLPTDDVEFHQRQTYLVAVGVTAAQAAATAAATAAAASGPASASTAVPETISSALAEKKIEEGLSAMATFAQVWIGARKDKGKQKIYSRHTHRDDPVDGGVMMPPQVGPDSLTHSAVESDSSTIEYRESILAGSHPLSHTHAPNQSSSTASDEQHDIPRTQGSFSKAPSATQKLSSLSARRRRIDQTDKRVSNGVASARRLRESPNQVLPPTSSFQTIVNPLHPPAGYTPGPGSMDVDLAALRQREEEWNRTHPNDKFEYKDQDFIPAVFAGVDDLVDGDAAAAAPTGAAATATPASRGSATHERGTPHDATDITINATNKYIPNQTTLANVLSTSTTTGSANMHTTTTAMPTTAPSTTPLIQGMRLQPQPPSSRPPAHSQSSQPSLSSSQSAVHHHPHRPQAATTKSVDEEKELDWTAFQFDNNPVAEVAPGVIKKDVDSLRFKTVELRPAVVASHAFRIKALVGALAVRIDLGQHFHQLFQRHFGFHAELERVFVSPLTGFVYVCYMPGRLPTRHIETVIREALVSEGHICCDVTAISMDVMKEEAFRCLYNLSRAPPPGSGIAAVETVVSEAEETGVPRDLSKDAQGPNHTGGIGVGVGYSPTHKVLPINTAAALPMPVAKNLQHLLQTSVPVISHKSTLIDSLADQLLQVQHSGSPTASEMAIDTPQLYPLRDPLNYHGLANSFVNKTQWVSPFVAATQGLPPNTTRPNTSNSATQKNRADARPSTRGSATARVAASSPAVPSVSAARRVHHESPSSVLTHVGGALITNYSDAIDADAVPHDAVDQAQAHAHAQPRTNYGYTTAPSIANGNRQSDLNTQIMYMPLSARLPTRTTVKRDSTDRVGAHTPHSALSLTPLASHPARSQYGPSSASAPQSARRDRMAPIASHAHAHAHAAGGESSSRPHSRAASSQLRPIPRPPPYAPYQHQHHQQLQATLKPTTFAFE